MSKTSTTQRWSIRNGLGHEVGYVAMDRDSTACPIANYAASAGTTSVKLKAAGYTARLMPPTTLMEACVNALPLLKHYENQLASSLSSDSRSHDADRHPRELLQDLIRLAEAGEPAPPRVVLAHPGRSSYSDGLFWVGIKDLKEGTGIWLKPGECLAVLPHRP